ncbi:MAG: DUF4861 family protein [Vicinamibacterales bacterium]
MSLPFRTTARVVVASALAFCTAPAVPVAGPAAAIVTAVNSLDIQRSSETIVLSAAEVGRAAGIVDLKTVHVVDQASGREVLSQAIDLDDDGRLDELVFQADFEPRATRSFSLSAGDRVVYTRDQFKAYGRFVRERRDDFAWENDRVAHRMYGAALETWVQEPLTSSGVDVWVKRAGRLVINDWYMVDDYHRDNGEGADLYSVGRTRGCGGNAPWIDGKMYPSGNFRGTRVIANGPIRVMFELSYEPWDAGGLRIGEVKRVTLDAGHHFNRFESTYRIYAAPRELHHAVGIRRNAGSEVLRSAHGLLRTWEPIKGNAGSLGCAVIADPASIADTPDTASEYLVVARVPKDGPAVYFAGSAWDKAGVITSAVVWDRYIDNMARRLRNPLRVTLEPAGRAGQ